MVCPDGGGSVAGPDDDGPVAATDGDGPVVAPDGEEPAAGPDGRQIYLPTASIHASRTPMISCEALLSNDVLLFPPAFELAKHRLSLHDSRKAFFSPTSRLIMSCHIEAARCHHIHLSNQTYFLQQCAKIVPC